ncbi:MAG: glycosyltransferase family 4 protein [Gemmatimonadota bacterium]|nr:MAG: glycosyltransferase family 4 protein [Gemmatimonadota bacterium]
MESHVAGLAQGLVGQGHVVDMLTSHSRPGLERDEDVAGVHVHRVWMPARTPIGWMAHVAATVPVHMQMACYADIFHAHTFACGLPPIVTRARHRRPFVLTLHTSHFLMRARRRSWRPVFRSIISSADYLLATSREILNVAQELYPHPRAEVMTNAVDTERFVPGLGREEKHRPRLIVPRRLFPKNGVEFFLRAMPLILNELDVEASIVGDGPEREKLVALAENLGVSERVEFLGARPNAQMPALLAAADLAVIPSLMEATSIAALEAMACGLPLAASAVGGLPEIIDEGVGMLFRPSDHAALAGAVLALLGRPDLRRMGEEGRRRVVEKWSLRRLVDRHVEIYSELLDDWKAVEKN